MLVSEIRNWLEQFDEDTNITGGALLETISGQKLDPDADILDCEWDHVDEYDEEDAAEDEYDDDDEYDDEDDFDE